MRQGIETAPRDGQDIVVEDDARVAFDVAHWSSEAGDWVWKNGQPIKIRPTHWSPITKHEYFQDDEQSSGPFQVTRASRGFRTSLAAATLVAAALIGVYFRSAIVASMRQYADQGSISRMSAIGGQEVLETERRAVDGLDLKLRPEAATASQSLGQRETAAARSELEQKAALSRKSDDDAAQRQAAEARAEELKQSLQQERLRAAGLTRELAAARSELEQKAALSRKSDDEAAQLRQVAEARAEELQQSLQQERQRAAGLMSELAVASSELEKKAALSRKSDDEAAQLRQAAEARGEELQQSRQQERQRGAALTPGLESTQGPPKARKTQEGAANSLPSETTSVAKPAAAGQPVTAEATVDPEAARLIARASTLLAQGNIGAARIVLERASEVGSAKASFVLAETYDPLILSGWGAYGTRGDAAKAREFYAKATVGGIQEAKDRLNALRQ